MILNDLICPVIFWESVTTKFRSAVAFSAVGGETVDPSPAISCTVPAPDGVITSETEGNTHAIWITTSSWPPNTLPGIDSLSPVAPFRILNIGNTRKVYLLDFLNVLEKEIGKKAIRNYLPMQKGDVKITLSDTSLLKNLTGYNPTINYKIGIRNFLNWYLSYYYKKN